MIGLLMLAAANVVATPSADARRDLTCFEATSWAIGTIGADTTKQAARANMETLRVFFLGRLSGRDDQTNWVITAQQDMHQKPETPSAYAAALEHCGQSFLAKVNGR